MIQAIRVHECGGPDILIWEAVELGAPGAGVVHIHHRVIGLNFIGTYFHSGLYPAPADLPFISGNEGAGVVLTVGEGMTNAVQPHRLAGRSGDHSGESFRRGGKENRQDWRQSGI